MPKVSVLMSAYNEEKYISEAIDSILSQTFSDFEFIIIDDGSSDSTVNIIKSYKDKRIKLIENEKNLGLIKSLNKGLDLAKGEYIARMDADDISVVDRFQKQVDFLDKNPEYILCGGWINLFPSEKTSDVGHHKEYISYFDILKGWCINHPTVMFRKNNLRYDQNYPVAEDYQMWSKMIKYGKIYNIQSILVNYRYNTGYNESFIHREKSLESCNKVKKDMLNFLTDDKKLQDKLTDLLESKDKYISFFKIKLFKISARSQRVYLFSFIPLFRVN